MQLVKETNQKIDNNTGDYADYKVADISLAAWGRKEIPYIHNRMAPGYYVCFTYQTPKAETVAELEAILRISEIVQKFQTHKTSLKSRKFKGNPKSKLTNESDDDLSDFDIEY